MPLNPTRWTFNFSHTTKMCLIISPCSRYQSRDKYIKTFVALYRQPTLHYVKHLTAMAELDGTLLLECLPGASLYSKWLSFTAKCILFQLRVMRERAEVIFLRHPVRISRGTDRGATRRSCVPAATALSVAARHQSCPLKKCPGCQSCCQSVHLTAPRCSSTLI